MRARKREKDAMKANGQIGPNARARTAAVSVGKEMNPHGMMPRTVSMMNQEKIGLESKIQSFDSNLFQLPGTK